MCTCTSCSYTDEFAGKGFAAWPRGEPKGKRVSDAEYRAHWNHCNAMREPVTFKPGQPPKFSTAGLNMPIPQAPKYIIDWINARGPLWKADEKPTPKPMPRLVALARQLREERRAERKAA